MDVVPSDALTGEQIKTSTDGLEALVNGCYAQFKDYPNANVANNWYLRQFFQLSDFGSDDIVCGYKTEDDLINSFRLKDRAAEKSNINSFWEVSYKIIFAANAAISMAERNDDLTRHLKGESYFLRAVSTHNLVRLFAKPYNQVNKGEPGVILRLDALDSKSKARATLEETYNYITGSLRTAASLMSSTIPDSRHNKGFASKYAVWAELSRVYLYKQEYDSCILYADSVINEGKDFTTLETSESYPTYFSQAKTRGETIWCIAFTDADDKKGASVASMICKLSDACWGEEGATMSLLRDMGFQTDLKDIDSRFAYIKVDAPAEKNGVKLYYISKFSNQSNSATLSSPVMLRLAEVYLNRAEAYAKKANLSKAVEDLTTLRQSRINVPEGHSLDDYYPTATPSDIVETVLKERRVELAFEGHRLFDLLRNNKDLVRNYWGYHIYNYNGLPTSTDPGLSAEGVVTKATDIKMIYPIPSGEISTNKLAVQNF
jgi:hypothetical protein